MKAINFKFEKINAEKKKSKSKDKLKVDSDISIESISEEKIKISKDKKPFRFDFEFIVKYEPGVANIVLGGFVIILLNKKKAKEVKKKWKKKKIPDDVRLPLFNMIFTKANIRALEYEEEFNLPSHIPMPKLKLPKNTKKSAKYTG